MGRMREAFIGGVNPGVDIFAAAAALVCGWGSGGNHILPSLCARASTWRSGQQSHFGDTCVLDSQLNGLFCYLCVKYSHAPQAEGGPLAAAELSTEPVAVVDFLAEATSLLSDATQQQHELMASIERAQQEVQCAQCSRALSKSGQLKRLAGNQLS
eukprot:1156965-Pelagomonas_calceolata.AAC.3